MKKKCGFSSIRLLIALGSVFGLLACSSAVPRTALFCGLRPGMTESEFLHPIPQRLPEQSLQNCGGRAFDSSQPAAVAPMVGQDIDRAMTASSRRIPARSVQIGEDEWDVWTYRIVVVLHTGGSGNVMAHDLLAFNSAVDDHREYVIFKNKRLVSWGLGYPSRAVLRHPDKVASVE